MPSVNGKYAKDFLYWLSVNLKINLPVTVNPLPCLDFCYALKNHISQMMRYIIWNFDISQRLGFINKTC